MYVIRQELNFLACVCSVCTHIWAGMTPVHACRGQRMSGIFLCHSLPYSFEAGSFTEPGACLFRIVGPAILSPHPQCWNYRYICRNTSVHQVDTGFHSLVLMLARQDLLITELVSLQPHKLKHFEKTKYEKLMSNN